MLVRAIHCEECNTTVYSRATDDLRECECGRVRVYGGFMGHFKYDITDKKTKFKKIKMVFGKTIIIKILRSYQQRKGKIASKSDSL